MPDNLKKRARNRRIGRIAAGFVRIVCSTLRIRLHDHCGFLTERPGHPLIHAVWHNEIFALPYVYSKNWFDRKGAVLTSASNDGEIVAAAMKCFGADSVRGSSSRRGAAALIELKKWINDGYDILLTPDGPRGPKHELNPGVVVLAQKTGTPILPTRLRYRTSWKLKTWDRFQIPVPFSRIDVHLGPYLEIPATFSPEEFEKQRLSVQAALCGEDAEQAAAKAGESDPEPVTA